MAKRKNNGNINTKSSKTNPLNDGVKNAADQQNLGAQLNMSAGAKRPEKTAK
jgi:hypothetical protein